VHDYRQPFDHAGSPPDQCRCWLCDCEYVYDDICKKFRPPCGCAVMLPMDDEGPDSRTPRPTCAADKATS
jgi:hypothetical protein